MWKEKRPKTFKKSTRNEFYAKVLGPLRKADRRSKNYQFVGYAEQ